MNAMDIYCEVLDSWIEKHYRNAMKRITEKIGNGCRPKTQELLRH